MPTTSPQRSRLVSRRRALASLTCAWATVAALVSLPIAANAAGPIPTGYTGWDISWPQCTGNDQTGTRTPPASSQFGIVGVSHGRSFTANSCLAAQFAWASGQSAPPSLYIVLDSPHSGGTYVNKGMTGPAGNCAAPPADMACNDYNYGWNNGVTEWANAQVGGASAQLWWLDIETGNCWDFACDGGFDTANNWRVIQGNLDFLRSKGVTVGIYSTGYQFGKIAGTSYSPGVPIWLADYDGGNPADDCGPSAKSFAGGQVWQVQSAPVTLGDGNRYDPDYSCPSPHGYWLDASDGGVFAFGNAPYYGSMGGTRLNKPIVGMAAPPQGGGYWMVASDGGIFSFGPNAGFHGSTGAMRLNQPIVGMASTPSGGGYWLVASDGGIFSFGDAGFHGSTGNIRLNQPVVGMAPRPTGEGYWLVASDGGIFSFGDAPFYGSTGGIKLNQPIVAMAPTHDGGGYWLVASDGGVFTFGDAPFYGSGASQKLSSSVVAIAATPDGLGYWMTTASGAVLGFGDALGYGSMAGKPLAQPIEGIAAST